MFLPFALFLAVTLFSLPRHERKVAGALKVILVSLFWLVAFTISGDRRLFFPFSLSLAFTVFALRGLAACLAMVALFVFFRIVQNATLSVLAVEVLLIIPALGFPLWLYSHSPKNRPRQLYYNALTSLLAFASLVF
ncbi:MAG: hypothetical protein ACK5ZJ_00920 [Acidobacteriota bacterium]